MITLYYHPGNASMAPHVLLRELGVPFSLHRVDRDAGEHKSPAYLQLNPNGQIPVLVDGDLVLYETVAIGLHLVDTHPDAGLIPPPGSGERAQVLKWLVWMTNTLQATLMVYFYPERWVDEGNASGASQVRAHAMTKVHGMLQQVDDLLASHGGPWLMGTRYGIADPYAFMLGRWTRGFAQRPAREYPHLGPYLQRMLQRPAVREMLRVEGLAEPFV